MLFTTRPPRNLVRPAMLAACLLWPAIAHAQTPVPVTLDATSTVRCRVTILGHESLWDYLPFTGSVSIAPPSAQGGPVTLSNLHIQVSNFTSVVPINSNFFVTVSGLTLNAASPSVQLAGQAATGASTSFSGAGIRESALGTVNYYATGLTCNTLTNGGAPCQGPFDLSLVPANTLGTVLSGSVTPGSSAASVSLVFNGTAYFLSGATWGKIDVQTNWTGTVAAQPPACRADFNGVGGLNVQDIFDYLSAWFAGNARADFNGANGITVQDIFDFLAAWFTGC